MKKKAEMWKLKKKKNISISTFKRKAKMSKMQIKIRKMSKLKK